MNARLLASVVVLALVSALCSAQVPAVMNYQGRLIQGTNLYNGQVGLSLQLWSAATGGLMLGEDSNTVTAVDGLYATVLGDDMPAGTLAQILNDNTNVYVRVLVNGAALAPRERLASAAYAVIPGLKGVGNVQAGVHSAVGGGETNAVFGAASVIGGGRGNLVDTNARESVIGGGERNWIATEASWTMIGGGLNNRIDTQSYCSVIGGGAGNCVTTLCAYSVIGGGWSNKIHNYADYAAIPGGRENEAGGDFAFAAGRRAKANHQGSFVWADSAGADFRSTASNQFLIRASGGVAIGTNVSLGALTVAGVVNAESLVGDGSGLIMLDGQNIQAGSISNAALGVGSVRGTNLAAASIGPDKMTVKYWEINGNNNVTAGVHFVGTTTTNPLEFRVSNARVMRFENAAVDSDPNVIGGHTYNLVAPGRVGATIAGGGGFLQHNEALDNYCAIGGGAGNIAGDDTSKEYATVAGGEDNRAEGGWSTIPGGSDNRASGFYSFAAGRRAKAVDDGAFVWADATDADFSSTANNQFIVRAAGGVGLNESDPRQQLSVGSCLDLYSGASNAPSQPSIRGSSLGNLFLNATNDTYINYDSGHDLIVNLGGGRVGIGTSSPAHALGVAGNGGFSGVVYADSFVGDGSGLTDLDGGNIMAMTVTTDQLAQAYWRLDGNANVAAGTHFIGTVIGVPLDLYAGNTRVLRLGLNHNVLGGDEANTIGGGAVGGTIAGGGNGSFPNRVELNYGTVGGGQGNAAEEVDATVGGGKSNTAAGPATFVGGGRNNTASGTNSVIAGGNNNSAAGAVSFIGGGTNNSVAGAYATLGGGRGNRIGNEGDYGVIAGGISNYLDSMEATIGGGRGNLAADLATVGGGESNKVHGRGAVIAGGARNSIDALSPYAAVGGGRYHTVEYYATNAVIGGGEENTITTATRGTIGGGWRNRIDHGDYAFIGGGTSNMTAGAHSAIGGGIGNAITINAPQAAIAGGYGNSVNANAGFIGGGSNNEVHVRSSSVVGGENNMASGEVAVVCGGLQNDVRGFGAFIGAGQDNSATGDLAVVCGGMDNDANGRYAVVPGGRYNVATGNKSLAAGYRSKAGHEGAFLWGDSTEADLVSTAADQFMVRARGGTIFYTDAAMSAGVELTAGAGSWTTLSDRNAKEDFRAVDAREILDRLAELPIATWKYKAQDAAIRHIGPVAQDFRAAFGVGEKPTGITTVDADGVALAAIQGLYEVVKEENARLRSENDELRQRLSAIEQKLGFEP
ncbi:MAG TPA: tail fiber domain-containing protein [Kiritimatiellia bacterium]|nr:tail fiber domain-containing protein [Kiritimatiellia bacterium]HRZ12687.1 tail fiber domain-containing protein [Kiritimatiellia bacterium]HSA19545.1 tail fiber domain-containing protein [Kiritimatiellia bacterium]